MVDSLKGLDIGKLLKSKRRKMAKKEAFQSAILPQLDESEFNEINKERIQAQKEMSEMSSLLNTTVSSYMNNKKDIASCRKKCEDEFKNSDSNSEDAVNMSDKKKACLAGCSLSNNYLIPKHPSAKGVDDETISTCKSLEKDGPQFCDTFVETANCRANGETTGFISSSDGPAGCNTNIPSNMSGKCICKDGSIKATVDCGHTNFNCNEVCQPNGKPYNYKKPPLKSDIEMLIGIGDARYLYLMEKTSDDPLNHSSLSWTQVDNLSPGDNGNQTVGEIGITCCVKSIVYYLGRLFGVGDGNKLWSRAAGEGWTSMQTDGGDNTCCVTSIAVYQGNLIGIGTPESDGKQYVYKWNWNVDKNGGRWELQNNGGFIGPYQNTCCVMDIGVHNGILYGIGTNKGLWQWTNVGSNVHEWKRLAGSGGDGEYIAVSSYMGRLIVIKTDRRVYAAVGNNGLPAEGGFKVISEGSVGNILGMTKSQFYDCFATNQGPTRWQNSFSPYKYTRQGAQQLCMSKGLKLCDKEQVMNAGGGDVNQCNSGWTTDSERGWWGGIKTVDGCGSTNTWNTWAPSGGLGGAHCCKTEGFGNMKSYRENFQNGSVLSSDILNTSCPASHPHGSENVHYGINQKLCCATPWYKDSSLPEEMNCLKGDIDYNNTGKQMCTTGEEVTKRFGNYYNSNKFVTVPKCKSNSNSNTDPNATSHIVTGNELVDECSSTEKTTRSQMNSDGASKLSANFNNYNAQKNTVSNKLTALKTRIMSIMNSRNNLTENGNEGSQELMNELQEYQKEYAILKRLNVGDDTLKGIEEDTRLKNVSAYTKYIFWLGLAICLLIAVIRQLKK